MKKLTCGCEQKTAQTLYYRNNETGQPMTYTYTELCPRHKKESDERLAKKRRRERMSSTEFVEAFIRKNALMFDSSFNRNEVAKRLQEIYQKGWDDGYENS